MSLLKVRDLSISFSPSKRAVEGVSLDVEAGKIVALVGESGCGKSLTALATMGLLKQKKSIEQSGQIHFGEKPLHTLGEREYRRLRGSDIAMIFQDPLTSLNPVFSVGNQLSEAIVLHCQPDSGARLSKAMVYEQAVELLRSVHIPDPERRMLEYPHQLSGGMRQRVMIAMALAAKPKLLIADEPTTALDVTIQAQILNLLLDLKDHSNMSVLLITHDLGVVAQICDYVYVMYAGHVVESGAVDTILSKPVHPYTKGLLQSMPVLGMRDKKLVSMPGSVPPLGERGAGCHFASRCPHVHEQCQQRPPLKQQGASQVACWLSEG